MTIPGTGFWWLIVPMLAAGIASLVACRLAMRHAPALGLLDRPGSEAHKQHARVVPCVGGLGMGVALLFALPLITWLHPQSAFSWAPPANHGSLWGLYGGALLLLVTGYVDDRKPLPPRSKLLAQGVAAGLAVWGSELSIDSLDRLVPHLGAVAAWLWLILVSNAFNLFDHADGLSGSVALVSGVVLMIVALLNGDLDVAKQQAALIGALAGFLWWNRPPARIYMGDAGSLPLGFLVAGGTLTVTFYDSMGTTSPWVMFTPLMLTALPLFDVAVVMVKRLRRGTPLMKGDRHHVGHRLVRLGLSPTGAMAVAVALQTALAANAIARRSADHVTGSIIMLQTMAVLGAVILLETTRDHGPKLG